MGARHTVVVGAGHNGLVAACYLAMAGRDVLVLEALAAPGGGARTAETVPGYRFDLHSVAHNIINMTRIPSELGLFDAGLEYKEMNPFSVAVHADGRRVRFHRSVEATVDSIAESSVEEARSYAAFMAKAVPVVRTVLPGGAGRASGQGRPRSLRRPGKGPAPQPGGDDPGRPGALRLAPAAVPHQRPHPGAGGRLRRPRRGGARPRRWGRCTPGGRPPTTCSGSGTPSAGPRGSPTPSSAGCRAWAARCGAGPGWRGSRRPGDG